jgi:quinol monooxygenase YgiN
MTDTKVTVIARIKAKPEKAEQVKQGLLKLILPTRSETGCINYDLHQSAMDDSLFLFHENWTSEDDLTRHLEAPHVKSWFEQADELLAEPVEITLWKQVG